MFNLLLIFVFFFFSGLLFGLEPEVAATPENSFAVTVGEKEQLMQKAEEMLKWFRSLNTTDKQRLSVNDFRSRLLPLELMQAAAILKQKQQPDMSRMLREILPYLQPTPLECFEIQERLGTEMLETFRQEPELLTGNTPDSVTQVNNGATRFLQDFLNPAEKLALLHEPQSPTEIMKIVDVLAIAGRPVIIRYYLRKFLAANSEPAEYAQIAELLGSRKLLQIANTKEFAPQGSEAVTKIYAEAKKFWQHDNTVAEAVENWQTTSQLQQHHQKLNNPKTLHALWNGQHVSASQLIEKLGETQNEHEIEGIIAVILSFSTDGRELLAVATNSENNTLAANAALGLARSIHAEETFLLYPILLAPSSLSEQQQHKIIQILQNRQLKLPNTENAAAELHARANDYFDRKRSLKPDFDGFVRFWNWDEKERKIKYIRMILSAAYRFFAYRYAEQAYRIKPEIQEIQRLYLTTLFERTAHLNGRDTKLDPNTTGLTNILAKTEPQPQQQRLRLEEILQFAIRKEHYAAAQVAAQLLGMLNDKESLKSNTHGEPSPLVQATVAKDQRVRFAALSAIMALQPETPYAGSSFVAETLVWFSRADGQRVLVSAHPKHTNAAQTAGFFISCGYQGELAQTCRAAMQLAAETPDTELVVVDLVTSEPSVAEFVQEMKIDPRTAQIPIALLTNNNALLESAPNPQPRNEMQHFDKITPNAPFALSLSQTYPRVVNDDGAKWINNDLFTKTNVELVPPALRLEQAHQALAWITTIVENSQNGQKLYHFEELEDTVLRALRSNGRIEQGLELAAVVNSAAMQAAIYEVAANSLLNIELRQLAANSFQKSFHRFGILLRGQQVQRLYDRYNASEFEPKETQELLESFINLIEKKTN
jgi:CheY-like chemotaxis protein